MYAPVLIFLAFLVYLYIGVSAFRLEPAKRQNQLCAAACCAYCLWTLAYVLINAAHASETRFYEAAAFGSVFFISFMLHFFFLRSGEKTGRQAGFFLPASYLPSVFFLAAGFYGAPGAENFTLLALHRAVPATEPHIFFRVFSAMHIAGMLTCLALIYAGKKSAASTGALSRARILLYAGTASLSLALLAGGVLPLFEVRLPLLFPAAATVLAVGALKGLEDERSLSLRDINVAEKVLNTIAEAIILTAPGGRIIAANTAAEELSGMNSGELLSTNISRILREEDGSELYESRLLAENMKNKSLLLKAQTGEEIPVLTHAAPLRGRSGRLEGISFILNDITEIKKTELLLRKNEQKYRDLWENAPLSYHVLDPSGSITDVNLTEARMLGYRKEEMLGREIFDFVSPGERENAKIRFFEKISGIAVPEGQKRKYRRRDGTDVSVSVHDAPQRGEGGKIIGIRTTMLDITKRIKAEEELKEAYGRLERSLEEMVLVIAKIVELRDPYTAGHGRKVAQLACRIAEKMGFTEDRINGIRMASIIHDIGKIYVPVEILSKPSKLSEIEFDIVKNHAATAHEILKDIAFPWPIAEIIHQHHERIDGSGYPRGLRGDDILPEAKIIGIADVTESMVSFRPYRPALGIEKAEEEIETKKDALYDGTISDICITLFTREGFEFEKEN